MGVLFERPGAAKVGQGMNSERNPGHILTISFFALNAFWKASRGSWECVRGQRKVPREGQERFSSSLWGPKRVPKRKGTLDKHRRGPGECPSRPKTEAEGPWENNCQRSSKSNRSKNKNPLSRPGPLARRIFPREIMRTRHF